MSAFVLPVPVSMTSNAEVEMPNTTWVSIGTFARTTAASRFCPSSSSRLNLMVSPVSIHLPAFMSAEAMDLGSPRLAVAGRQVGQDPGRQRRGDGDHPRPTRGPVDQAFQDVDLGLERGRGSMTRGSRSRSRSCVTGFMVGIGTSPNVSPFAPRRRRQGGEDHRK